MTRTLRFVIGSVWLCVGCGEDTTTPVSPTAENLILYTATLSPQNEVPPPTPSNGSGEVTGGLSGTTLTISGSYAGLTGPAIDAHVHVAPVGVAGPIVCPLVYTEGPTIGSGTLSGDCPNTSVSDLDAGNLYVNVHTAANPPGEIRGQLVRAQGNGTTPTPSEPQGEPPPAPAPEPPPPIIYR